MKFKLQLLLLFAGTALFIACGGSKNKTGEPNDSILQANFIKIGKPVKMKIDSAHDRDWYAVEVPDSGYIKVGKKDVPGDITAEVRFADKQEWESTKHDWFTGWDELPKAIQDHERDTIYFAIQDKHQNDRSPKSFKVRVEFTKEFDQYELNNDPKNTKEKKTGQAITSYIYPVGDKDWFKFEVEKQGYLMSRIGDVPEGVDPEVKFAQRDSLSGKMEWLSSYCDIPCGLQILEKGTYFVLFKDKHSNDASRDPVKWKLDFIDEMDETEPNNERAEADSLSIPDTVTVAIFPTGDDDYFKLTPEQDQKLLIRATSVESVTPEIRLHRKTGVESAETSDWQELSADVSLKGGETYFLQLQDKHDNDRNPEPFQLMILQREAS